MHVVSNIKYSAFYLYCQYKFQKNQQAVSAKRREKRTGRRGAFRLRLCGKESFGKRNPAAKGEVL